MSLTPTRATRCDLQQPFDRQPDVAAQELADLFLRGFKPAPDRILRILNGFKFRRAIRHVARKLGHGREKSSAVLGRQRFDDDGIVWTFAVLGFINV